MPWLHGEDQGSVGCLILLPAVYMRQHEQSTAPCLAHRQTLLTCLRYRPGPRLLAMCIEGFHRCLQTLLARQTPLWASSCHASYK